MAGGQVEFAQIHAACDNQYELFVNGQPAGNGADWRKMDVHEVTKLMRPGVNVVAVKATNSDAGTGRHRGPRDRQRARRHVRKLLDRRNLAHERQRSAELESAEFRDRTWLAAKVYGPLGGVLPWGDEVVISNEGSRFMIDPEFAIERMVTDEQAGSLIAMAFNAKGEHPGFAGRRAAALDQRRRPRRHLRNGAAVLRQAQERARHPVARCVS